VTSVGFSCAEPHSHGMLDVGDGNRVYWEERGNPAGKPALVVHGGPGTGSPTGTPKLFDPQHYRVVGGLPGARRADPVAAYARLVEDADPQVRTLASLRWVAWEDTVLSLEPHGRLRPYSDGASEALLAFVRICVHYAANTGWLPDGALLRGAGRVEPGLPCRTGSAVPNPFGPRPAGPAMSCRAEISGRRAVRAQCPP
jgi:hypothetical protein